MQHLDTETRRAVDEFRSTLPGLRRHFPEWTVDLGVEKLDGGDCWVPVIMECPEEALVLRVYVWGTARVDSMGPELAATIAFASVLERVDLRRRRWSPLPL